VKAEKVGNIAHLPFVFLKGLVLYLISLEGYRENCTCFLPFLLSVIINLRDYTLVGTQKFFKSTTFLLPHPFVDEKDKTVKNKMMRETSLQRIKLFMLLPLSYFYLIFELFFNKSEVNISNYDILVIL